MAGAESFTILAILEARDTASEIFAKVDESLDKFSESAGKAADSAKVAGDAIDDSLLQTASGADALDLATARVDAAQAAAAESAKALADAETALLDAQRAAAGAADEDAASTDALIAASKALTDAQKDAAVAAKAVSDAQKVQSDTAVAAAAKNDEAAVSTTAVKDASEAGGVSLATMGKVAGITAIGLGVAGALMVKAAGNFQSSTEHLVTDAGESQAKLGMVRAGILSISTSTGTAASDITDAMYHIESGGFHAQTALDMAKVAAEGAKVGGADLDTVSKTLVGTMNAYYGSTTNASNATQRSTSMMEQMVATVGSGDMRMQDLASSLSNVAPLAASAGISFAQVGGAIATMTDQGMSAQQSTQDLNNVIRNIVKPSATASNEMRALGISALQVQQDVGKQGLTGTLNEYTQAILANSKGGQVSLGYMKLMTPATQALAQGILSGKLSTEQLRLATYNLNPQQAKLLSLFDTSATSATGLKQSYDGAMASLTGGATGLNVAMMLTGKNTKTFADSVANITKQGQGAATLTKSWAAIQATLNQKFDVAKTGVENAGTAIGTSLLPAVTSVMSVVTKVTMAVADWTAKHQKLTEIIFVSVTAIAAAVAVIAIAKKAFDAVSGAVKTVQATLKALGNIAKSTADTQKASAESAAGAQEEAATESAAVQEGAAEDVAAANEEASVESSGSWLAAAANQIATGLEWAARSAAQLAVVVAQNVAAAATTAASWVAAGAQQVAGAAVWVAQTVAKVAVIVASNVAGAAVTLAAWVAANAAMLLGIGLIVVAVVAAVLLIVKYWSDIEKAAVAVWDAIVSAAKTAWSGITTLVKAIWSDITGDIQAAHALIMKIVGAAWNYVKDLINEDISDVKSTLSWFGRLGSLFRGWWNDATGAVRDEAGQMLSFVESIPGRILSALGDVGSLLFGAGKKIIQGLINGIENMVGSVGSAIGSVASTIKSFLPFSPAKQGPLSGAGAPENSGAAIAKNLAKGMIGGVGGVTSASHLLASSAALGHAGSSGSGLGLGLTASSAGGAAGAGGVNITVDLRGSSIMSDSDINKLMGKMGPALTKALGQAGVKVRMR